MNDNSDVQTSFSTRGTIEGDFSVPRFDPVACSASFQHLLRTNDPPPDSEAKRLRNTLLREAQEGVIRLEQRAARLLAAAKEAQEERDNLQQFIDSHKIILSPVRRIPAEIIAEIFLHLRGHAYEVFDSRRAPWVLGQICRRWRSVALACSELWSSMSLHTLTSHKDVPFSYCSTMMCTALSRSGRRELSVHFRGDVFPPHIQANILAELSHHTSRMKFFQVGLDSASLFDCLKAFKGSFQSLSELEIHVSDFQSWSLDEVTDILDTFETAPRLRRILLDGIGYPDRSIKLPWAQLTCIPFHDTHQVAVRSVLRLAPALEDVTVHIPEEPSEDDAVDGSMVVHPVLRSLSLYGQGCIPPNLILSGLTDVALCAWGEPGQKCDPESLPALYELLRRSHCSLLKLHLSDVDMRNGLYQLLRSVPSLTHLKITHGCFGEDEDLDFAQLIEDLVYDPLAEARAVLLPKLEVLELLLQVCTDPFQKDRPGPVGVTAVNGLCSLIDSRMLPATTPSRSVLPLRKVTFNADDAVYSTLGRAHIEVLKRHKENGLDLTIATHRTTFHADHSSPELDDEAFRQADGSSLVSKIDTKTYV